VGSGVVGQSFCGGGEGAEFGFVWHGVVVGVGLVAGQGLGVAFLESGVFFFCVDSWEDVVVVEEVGFSGGGSS
jgi:hypothetical protein